jgi:hypothetical protein
VVEEDLGGEEAFEGDCAQVRGPELIRAHRHRLRSRWRRLDPARQALLVLAHLRNGDTCARLAAGFGVGVATAGRYVREAVDLLAATAPPLDQAMRTIRGPAFVILDGT